MVYYIVACTKEGQDEKQVEAMVLKDVLANGSRPLGECFSLTNSVSYITFLIIKVFID
jgi:hypothetical protein